jgi:hypothetical protein
VAREILVESTKAVFTEIGTDRKCPDDVSGDRDYMPPPWPLVASASPKMQTSFKNARLDLRLIGPIATTVFQAIIKLRIVPT